MGRRIQFLQRLSFSFLVLVGMGWAQVWGNFGQVGGSEVANAPQEILPDAPPVSTTCEDHGKPCPEWLHKLIGQYPPTHESSPFAPVTWKEAGLRKRFWLPHTGMALSGVLDVEATHQGLANCHWAQEGNPELPPHPSRGQLYRYTGEFIGGFTLADYLLAKAGFPWFTYDTAPVVGSIIHIKGAMGWINSGCVF